MAKENNLEQFLFKSKLQTDSILLYQNGRVILEKYANGYDKKSFHIMWSVSKSFTSALVGIAIKEKKLLLQDSVCKYFPKYKKSEKCKITIEHLLSYTAGFQWNEEYEPATIEKSLSMDKSDVLQMMYGSGAKDVASYVMDKKLKFVPGTTVQYNTGTPNILMKILQIIYQKQYDNWIKSSLFDQIDSDGFRWLKDKSGNYLGGSHLYTTTQTMLNFGRLYLNNGSFKGREILSKEWIKKSTKLTVSKKIIDHQDLPGKDIIESTGFMWWLNQPIKNEIPWKDAPSDTYIAWGHWSQFIIIIPSRKMIIVRTGLDKTQYFDVNRFIKLCLNYVSERKELISGE